MVKRTKKRINKKRRITRKKRGGQIKLNTSGFVGDPWGPKPSQWPEEHNGNWYTLNPYKTMIGYNSLSSNIKGGRKKKQKKGGTLLPSDIIDLYQGLKYNFGTLSSSLTTAKMPVNPAPYSQPSLTNPSPYN